jgi:hypothetical protein
MAFSLRTGLCAGGEFNVPSAEPSAEYRIKKLIICSFADRIPLAGTADDGCTIADVYFFSPTCTKPHVSGWRLENSLTISVKV